MIRSRGALTARGAEAVELAFARLDYSSQIRRAASTESGAISGAPSTTRSFWKFARPLST